MYKLLLALVVFLSIPTAYASKLISVTESFEATVIKEYVSNDPNKCSMSIGAGGGAAVGAATGATYGLIAGPLGVAIGSGAGTLLGALVGYQASCEVSVKELKKSDGSIIELIDYKGPLYNLEGKKVNVKILSNGMIRLDLVK